MSTTTQNGKGFAFPLDIQQSGVPVYRQIIDQATGGMAASALKPGDQLPTVRKLAVDLTINPNTVVRAYRELEIRGVLETQQGTGTFISQQKIEARRSGAAAPSKPAGERVRGARRGRRLHGERTHRRVVGFSIRSGKERKVTP